MKFVNSGEEELGKHGLGVVILLTGDGKLEQKVLRVLCSRFNAEKSNKYILSISFRESLSRNVKYEKKGLASLEVIKILTRYAENFLWTCDMEHVKPGEWLEQVKEKLREHGFTDIKVENEMTRAARLGVELAGRKIRLWVAITGESKSIEEDLEKLSEGIPRNQRLRFREREVEQIIRQADDERLRYALPSLTSVLEDMHHDC